MLRTGRPRLLLKLLFSLPLAAAMFAETRTGCAVTTITDATAVLGPGTQQREVSNICIFSGKQGSVTVALTANATVAFQNMKYTALQSGGTVKDEPGIGNAAFSVTPKDGKGFSIFVLKGTWGAAISEEAIKSELARAKLRELAKKAAARM